MTVIPTVVFWYDLAGRFGLDFWRDPGAAAVNRIEFNRLNGCAAGDLSGRVAAFFDDAAYQFEGGAGQLRICATTVLTARPEAMARAVAESFPGCLAFRSHDRTLRLVPNPDAVCVARVGSGRVFICDGDAAAAVVPPVGQVDMAQVPDCESGWGR